MVASHAAAALFIEIRSPNDLRRATSRLVMPLAAIVLSAALTVACYAPMLGGVIDYYVHGSGKMKGLSTPGWALLETVRGLQLGFGSQAVLAAGAFLIGCGLWDYWRENRMAFFLLVLPGLFTILGLAVVLGKMYPRYLFPLAGFAILIVVRGAMVLGSAASQVAPFLLGEASAQPAAELASISGDSSASCTEWCPSPHQARPCNRYRQHHACDRHLGWLAGPGGSPSQTGFLRGHATVGRFACNNCQAGSDGRAAAWPIAAATKPRDWRQLMDIKQIEAFKSGSTRSWADLHLSPVHRGRDAWTDGRDPSPVSDGPGFSGNARAWRSFCLSQRRW